MNKSLIITVASALVLAVAGQAGEPGKGAGGQPLHKPHEMSLVPPKLVEKLNLTDAQQAQLKEIETAFDEARDALFAGKKKQLVALDEQARAARQANNEAQLKEIRQQRRDLMQPLGALRRQYMEKFRGILTADQKAQLAEEHARIKERRGQHGDKPPAPPPE